ncbi:hypothetical protein LTR41_011871 [Exophiala xenobiotica]|nr:hypothetical protein LTR41_011871 [Exophiala xenobiotica]KAK5550290.1 hypothetical protein LTR46_011705 [Exophiala xenobiotica]
MDKSSILSESLRSCALLSIGLLAFGAMFELWALMKNDGDREKGERHRRVKSDYGRIKEGSHSHHGLNYPESFLADTFSRQRTHVIDERNRRNRLTRAIQTLQGLIPETDAVGQQKKGPCKAITVARAIDYIIALQRQVDQLRKASSATAQGAGVLFDPDASSNNAANC